VPLATLDKRLAGVVALADETMFVGSSGKSAVLMGALPEEYTTQDEVRSFVTSLLEHERISFESAKKGAVAASETTAITTTHAIRVRQGKKVLVRLRFFCP